MNFPGTCVAAMVGTAMLGVWLCPAIAHGGASDDVEATSLLGKPLRRPDIPPDRRTRLEKDLANAKAAYDNDPTDVSAAIWYGRRLAYLGRYRDAIDVFSEAIGEHPGSYKLLRHRGHRLITVRKLDDAIADLQDAAGFAQDVGDAPEPDGAPNSKNIPRSTNQSNIWYHLALAHYLKGDFDAALPAWERCMTFSRVNDDMLVATSYWLYLTLRRTGDAPGAAKVLEPIRPKMDVIENHAYHRLLLMFKGKISEAEVLDDIADDAIADATIGYGIGAWKLINGDTAGAHERFEKVLADPNWAAFGYIAAEAEMARQRGKQ
jgi:predicted Zn-dependent protease